MLIEQIEHRWLDAFERTFALCKINEGDVVALLTESQSRRVNVDLARITLQRMGAKIFEVCLPTPALSAPAAASRAARRRTPCFKTSLRCSAAARTASVTVRFANHPHAPKAPPRKNKP